MLNVRQILVIGASLTALGVGLSGCGLKGPLYLPTDPAASQRATLPQVLTPSVGGAAAAAPVPAAAASAPAGAAK
ncbi:MAG: lipoprotein [Pseudomonadota bacterium]